MTLSTRSALPEDEAAVVELWRRCDLVASYNDPAADFRFARSVAASDVLVAVGSDGGICGSAMVRHDGHWGWIYYVAADLGGQQERHRPGGDPRCRGLAVVPWCRQAAAAGARDEHWSGVVLRASRL